MGVGAGCFLLATSLTAADTPRLPAALTGIVVKVFDGDSLIVRANGADVEVRLADVDAPEKGQPYADEARRSLAGLVHQRNVSLEVLDVDQFHRKVARVRRASDGLDINSEVVLRGNAWVYRRYVRDQSLFAAERSAKDRRAGLWALPEDQRIPPWRYRSIERRKLN